MLVTKIETRICKKAIMKKMMGIYHTSFLQKNSPQVAMMKLRQMWKYKIVVVHFEFQHEVY